MVRNTTLLYVMVIVMPENATGAPAMMVVEIISINFPLPVTPTSESKTGVSSLMVHRAQVAVRLDGPENASAVAVVIAANVSVPVGVSVAHVVELDDEH